MGWFKKKEEWRLAKMLDTQGALVGTQLLRLNPNAKRQEYPYLVYFTLFAPGLPHASDTDWETLTYVDEQLESLETELGFLVVGVMTLEGKRDSILYARNGPRLLSDLYERLGAYSPQMEWRNDEGWAQYRDLLKMK